MVNTIDTVLVDDDSLSQRQIAFVGISQTTVKKIILSLFFPAISVRVYAYVFTRNVRKGILLLGWFLHRLCNKLWATCCFFYFFDSRHSRLVMGLVSLLKTQPYINRVVVSIFCVPCTTKHQTSIFIMNLHQVIRTGPTKWEPPP